jgi:DNA-binding response OmpR family regulator
VKSRILVIDDDRLVADAVAMVLSAHGYEVRTAYGGAEGVKSGRAFLPHVVISDVMMPQVNGVEAAIRICRHLPTCRILLVSGEMDAARRLMKSKSISFELLSKPLSPRSLLFKLRSLVLGVPRRKAS